MADFHIQLLATGGTLAKRYETVTGELIVDNNVVDTLVSELKLPATEVNIRHLLARDSLDMTQTDRDVVVEAVRRHAGTADAIVVTHGTDTLATTAALLDAQIAEPPVPVVLTGAMTPYCCTGSDALQNVTEAVMACRLLAAGIHVAFHGRVLPGDGVVKDYHAMTFVSATE